MFNTTGLEERLKNPTTLVCVSHSGGKDSQAMYLFLKNLVPKERLIVIHANLGHIEWPGTIEHIKSTIEHELFITKAKKTLFDMARHRGMWPSPKFRQCTSDLKRGPIRRIIRKISSERGFTFVLDCVGIRAQESGNRSKLKPFQFKKDLWTKKRLWAQWYPIFDWTEETVFQFIKDNGQSPHWAYGAGMSRLSCSFCIMSNNSDLMTAAKLRPDLLAEYVELEKEIGQTFKMPVNGHTYRLDEYIKRLERKEAEKNSQLSLFDNSCNYQT